MILNDLKKIMDLVGGLGNLLTIMTFILAALLSIYFYFKTFYRLVYSTGRVSRNGNIITDWKDENNEFISRILFFNNGRKTLTKGEVKNLTINSSATIFSTKILHGGENIKLHVRKRKVSIDIEYLDSSDIFVLEIEHNGTLSVEGRISETGKLLHTETRVWIILNVLLMIYFLYALYKSISPYMTDNKSFHFEQTTIINWIILLGLVVITRIIHALFFIPDRISSKYLDEKDKFLTKFKRQF